MIFSVFWENPAVVGLILAIPSAVLGYLGYRRSRAIDEATEEAVTATGHVVSIQQVIDGLNGVIAALQADNKVLREDVALRRLKALASELEKVNGT